MIVEILLWAILPAILNSIYIAKKDLFPGLKKNLTLGRGIANEVLQQKEEKLMKFLKRKNMQMTKV